MDIKSKQFDQAMVVSVSGSIDALTAGEVSDYMLKQIRAGNEWLILDLSGIDFMSSAGLRAILITLKESRIQGGDLRLASAQPGVEKILNMSGFTRVMKTFPNVQEAIASIPATP